jgi:hypothetical protein
MSVEVSDALSGIQTQSVGELPAPAGQPGVDGPVGAEPVAETAVGDVQQPAPAEQIVDHQQPDAQDKRSPGYRFSQLTADRNKAQQEAAYWRGVAEAFQRGQAPGAPQNAVAAPEAPQPPSAPNPTLYEYGEVDPRYLADLAKHHGREEAAALFREQQEKAEADARARAEAARHNEGLTRFKTVVDETRSAGFEAGAEVLRAVAADTQTADLIATSSHPAHLAEWLGRNPDYFNDIVAADSIAERARLVERAAVHVSTYVEARRRQASARPTPSTAQPAPAPQPAPAAAPAPATPGLTATTGVQGRGGAVPFNPDTAAFSDLEARFRSLHTRSR